MKIDSAGAVQGLYQAQQQLHKQSSTIASKETQEGKSDVTEALVEMKNSKNQFQASAKAVQTEDEVLGTLLDTKA